jgi:hypothetical protein
MCRATTVSVAGSSPTTTSSSASIRTRPPGGSYASRPGLQLEPALAEIESLATGAWHLVFHYRAAAAATDAVRGGANLAAAEWFPLDALPPEAEQAHEGWARDVLSRLFA